MDGLLFFILFPTLKGSWQPSIFCGVCQYFFSTFVRGKLRRSRASAAGYVWRRDTEETSLGSSTALPAPSRRVALLPVPSRGCDGASAHRLRRGPKWAEPRASPTRSDPLACCRLPSQAFLAPRPGVLAPGSTGGRQQQVAGSSAPLAGCQRLGSCARGLLLLAALEQRARRGLLSQELWSDGARDRSLQAINNPPQCHPASLQQGHGFCRAGEVVSWARRPGGLLAPTAWWPGAVRLWHLAPRAAPSPHPHVTGSWHMTAWAGTPRLFHGRRLAR